MTTTDGPTTASASGPAAGPRRAVTPVAVQAVAVSLAAPEPAAACSYSKSITIDHTQIDDPVSPGTCAATLTDYPVLFPAASTPPWTRSPRICSRRRERGAVAAFSPPASPSTRARYLHALLDLLDTDLLLADPATRLR